VKRPIVQQVRNPRRPRDGHPAQNPVVVVERRIERKVYPAINWQDPRVNAM
jgi:hypothetical protein